MSYQARILEDGSMVFEADFAKALGLQPGDVVQGEWDNGRLALRTYADIVAEGQARFRALLPDGFEGSLVDSLIADRRAEYRCS